MKEMKRGKKEKETPSVVQWHYSGYQEHSTLNDFFCYIGKWNIKCCRDDTPCSTGGSFVMETFDWRPRKCYFRKWKNVVVGRVFLIVTAVKKQISHTENQTNFCITVKWLSWEYFPRIQKRKKKKKNLTYWYMNTVYRLYSLFLRKRQYANRWFILAGIQNAVPLL